MNIENFNDLRELISICKEHELQNITVGNVTISFQQKWEEKSYNLDKILPDELKINKDMTDEELQEEIRYWSSK